MGANETDRAHIAELVIRSAAGDNFSFRQLYDETYGIVFSTAYAILRNRETAKDIVQETYLCAWNKLNTVEDPTAFVSWLNTIAANKSKNYLSRTKHLRHETPDENISDNFTDARGMLTPDEEAMADENRELIETVIDSLSPEQRICIVLRYMSDMSVSQISQSLELPEGTVKSRLHYAKVTLKEKLHKTNLLNAAEPGALLGYALTKESAESTLEAKAVGEIFQNVTRIHTASLTAPLTLSAKAAAFFTVNRVAAFVGGTIVMLGGMTAAIKIAESRAAEQSTALESDTACYEVSYEEQLDSTRDELTDGVFFSEQGTVFFEATTNKKTTATAVPENSTARTTAFSPESIPTVRTATTAYAATEPTATVQHQTTTIKQPTTTQAPVTTAATTASPTTTGAADSYSFTSLGNGFAVSSYSGSGGAVTIPSEYNGKAVTAVASSAFRGKTSVTSLTVPKACATIGDMAFSGCTGLKTVILNDGVKSIGTWAFYGCSSLTSITIPDSVTSISDDAFDGCDSVTIRCSQGSYAHTYAVENSISYMYI